MVSVNAGMPARPRRVATSPSCATPSRDSHLSSARSQTGRPKVAAYCSARHSTCVSVIGHLACEKATQPASASSAISVRRSPASFTVSAPTG